MRKLLIILGVLLSVSAHAQNGLERIGGIFFNGGGTRSEPRYEKPKPEPDDFRIVDGVVYNATKSEKWEKIPRSGHLPGLSVHAIVQGGVILQEYDHAYANSGGYRIDRLKYFVKNYPNSKKLITSEEVSPIRVFPIGVVDYEGDRIKAFDYGTETSAPPPPPPTPEQLQAMASAKAAKEKLAQQTASKVLKSQQERAAAGYPSSQYDLGMRYLKGDGVPKDEKLAKEWLEKAAAQDNAEAKAALAKLQTHSNP